MEDLSNDKVYVLKSGRTTADASHYLLYHTDAPNNLSSTYSGQGHNLEYNAATQNFHFAIYKHEGKYYFYNIAAGKFIGNNNNDNGAIPLVEMPTNSIEIRSSNDNTYKFVLSTNGTGALNAADTQGCHGVVNWTGGYGNLGDKGNIYQIIEVADLEAETKSIIEERVNIGVVLSAAQAAVDAASNTLVGAYTTASVQTLSEKLVAYNSNNSAENFNAVKQAYEAFLENGEKVALSEGEVFTVKCVEDSRGYMVYSTVEGKGSETQVYLAGSWNTTHHAAIDAVGVYKEWAYVEVDGKKYIFNTENKKFITSDDVVQFSDMGHAFNFVDIGNALWEIQFEANNKYLSYSPGWGANSVRTEGSVDNGCKFYIEKADQSLGAGVLTAMEDKINAAKLETWKNANLVSLGYVGGYPASMADAIKSVATYSGALTFDVENAAQRKALTEGYYYIKGTGVGNGADWYASYGNDATPGFCVPPLGAEKPGIKNIWKFVACDEDGYKLMACNLNKYVLLENAEANSSAPSAINSEYEDGSKFIFNNQGAGNFIIKDANDNVLRSEGSDNGYALNYWWGEKNETWYIIPATDIEVVVGEEAGYATTYLPFDVVVPNTVEAYAVTATSNEYATLTKMEDISANNGAILKGEGTHTLTIAQANSDWTGNLLKGTNVSANITDAAYIFAKKGDNVGFYPVEFGVNTDDDAATFEAFKNNANKAYLPASAVPSGVRFLSFDFGSETSIDELKSENGNVKTVVYDLSGRRVQKAQKGVFIVNGKVVIK